MNKHTYLALILLLVPFLADAQTSSLQNIFANTIIVIRTTVIPLLLGIGFLFIAINVVRFFIIGGSNEEGRDKAKSLALYGVGAFVFLLIFWGIVNLLSDSIGLNRCGAMQSDYTNRTKGANPCLTSPIAPSETNQPTTPTTPNPDLINTDNLDLSVDNIADTDAVIPSTDSPAGCISFSTNGICLDPAPPSDQSDFLTDSFRETVTIGRNIDGQNFSIGPVTTTPNSTSYEITNDDTGETFRISYTSINVGPGNDDYMLRIEELRRPGDTSTTPPRWSTTRITFNENTNQMDIFIVSNTTTYEQTLNGTAYVNNQGQFVMRIVDRYGRETISTVDSWVTRTLRGEPGTAISENTTPTPEAIPPDAPTPDYTVR